MKYLRRAFLSILSTSIIAFATESAEDDSSSSPWKFIVMADWHGAEWFASNPGPDSNRYKEQASLLSNMHDNYGGDQVILPGDTQQGNWNVPSWINKRFPGISAPKAVYRAG